MTKRKLRNPSPIPALRRRGPPPPLPGPRAARGDDTLQAQPRGPTGSCGTRRTPAPGRVVGSRPRCPCKCGAQLVFLWDSEAPPEELTIYVTL